MRPAPRILASLLFAAIFSSGSVQSDDASWPCWRGPRGDGISGEKRAPVRWSPQENVAWRAEIPGRAHSTPIIWKDALFLTTAVPDGGDVRRALLRFDKKSGRKVWERDILKAPPEGKHQKNSHASGTPATDGERIYLAFCANGRAQAFATTLDGDPVWSASPCEFRSVHGHSTTPVLFEDLVILNCDQDSAEASLVALERTTGKQRWRAERENRTRSYVTPVIASLAGRDQLVISGSKTVASYDPRSGKRLWICDGPTEQCVATPAVGHGLVFITGGFPDREILAIRPDGQGDVTRTHIAWRSRQGPAYVPSPVLVSDHLFVVRDEGGVLTCFEAKTGKVLFQERLGGNFSSSLAYAAGNIYASNEEGTVHVFAAAPRFERVSAIDMGEGIFATPVFSEGKLYLRTTKALYCICDGAVSRSPGETIPCAFPAGATAEAGSAPAAAPAAAADPSDPSHLSRRISVFDPPRVPQDIRLGKPRDLNGYHPWTPITDPAAWKARARKVRERVLVAAGLWPLPEPAPLNPTVHGEIDRGDYTVAKVFFQSYPGFYVTGNLYRPKAPAQGKRPAVLSPHGHWQNGRFYERPLKDAQEEIRRGREKTLEGARFLLQARCAQLARMGCVVFHYDMVGNADSTQIPHGQGFRDAEAELRLQSAFGLQTYDSIRAFDFLSSLPDVDPARIGVTGASGGGTQTFILCAVDDRPAVAFPAVMVSTSMQGGCVCENASHLRVGTGNIEFAALCAPRPLAMTGADDWTIEIETKGYPELKALYTALGVPDLVLAKCYPQFDHNYNQVSREMMYGWMNRHLKLGLPEPVAEKPFEPIPPKELSVFDAAHPRPADAVDAPALRRHLTETSEKHLAALRPKDGASLEEFRKVAGTALEVMLWTSLPDPGDLEAKEAGESTTSVGGKAVAVSRLLLSRKGSGEEVPAVALRPKEGKGPVVVLVHPGGKEGALVGPDGGWGALAAGLLERGATILSPDPFLTGEYHLPGQHTPAPPVNKDYAGYTFGYNRTLLAQRVHDILTAVACARKMAGGKPVVLAGLWKAGPWALLALPAAGDAVSRAFVDLDWFSFQDVRSTADEMMLPGALKYGDVPAFAALRAPLDLWLAAPPESMDFARDAFRAAGAGDALRIDIEKPAPDRLADWLLGKTRRGSF